MKINKKYHTKSVKAEFDKLDASLKIYMYQAMKLIA